MNIYKVHCVTPDKQTDTAENGVAFFILIEQCTVRVCVFFTLILDYFYQTKSFQILALICVI